MMSVPKTFYVIRWSRIDTFGRDFCEDSPWYTYVKEIRLGLAARGVWVDPDPQKAIKFSSWAEAAAVAAFIIHHVDELYEDVLEVVKIDS